VNTTKLSATILILILFVCSACADKGTTVASNSPGTGVNPSGELHFKVPEGWISENPTSAMRIAQYKLPKIEGDPEDASLVLYYFGAQQGGAVQANIDRWIGQMQNPTAHLQKTKLKLKT